MTEKEVLDHPGMDRNHLIRKILVISDETDVDFFLLYYICTTPRQN